MMRQVGAVIAVGVVITLFIVALAGVTKHEERPPLPDSSVRISVGVEIRSEHLSPSIAQLVHNACVTTLPEGVEMHTETVDDQLAITLTPAPDNEGLRPFTGCLNDVTIDHVQTWVIEVTRDGPMQQP